MATPPDDILDLLTAYALDALEPEEMTRIGELLDHDPELRALLAELRATAHDLPFGLPDVAPPPELRQKVLDHAVGRTTRSAVPPVSQVRAARGPRGWLAGLGALAAGSLVAAALAWAQLGSVRAELDRTRSALEQQVAANNQIAEVLATSPNQVALAGAGGTATVVRDPGGELLVAAKLPPLAAGRVYQLWTIEGQNAPVSAGVFTVDENGVGIASINVGQLPTEPVFAVTEEPGPNGSDGPTTRPLVTSLPAS